VIHNIINITINRQSYYTLPKINIGRLLFLFSGNQACKGNRVFQVPRIGVADDKVAQYASLHYYNDKELQVTFNAANTCVYYNTHIYI